ncbi:MAG: MerR family transcriptional regulator [Gemmatimonadetes bacterium]|nr:MerR family transcriptional regulator [Gemmatimonadota bacterium]
MDPIARKTYYSIGEVSALTGLEAHVLRYWETQFDMLSPSRNRGGTRVYRMREIETILLVKHLLHEKCFTIEGARKELETMRSGGDISETRRLNAEPAMMSLIKDGLDNLRDTLTLPEG